MTGLVLAAVFLAGVTVGALTTIRLSPRLVARLSPIERLEFARRVTALARRRAA